MPHQFQWGKMCKNDEYDAEGALKAGNIIATTVMCVYYDSPQELPVSEIFLSPICRWTVNELNPQWTLDAVIDALATLPLLQDFRITIAFGANPLLKLNRLPGFTFSGSYHRYHRSGIATSLMDAVAKSPHLAHLEVGAKTCALFRFVTCWPKYPLARPFYWNIPPCSPSVSGRLHWIFKLLS